MIEAVGMYLPRSSSELVSLCSSVKRHPGLLLDKLSRIGHGDMKSQHEALLAVAGCQGDDGLLQALHERRRDSLGAIESTVRFRLTTQGHLTLHLARSGVLENAGIALHPTYGFTHLPGSGLKGLARAWAETVWVPGQSDVETAWRQVEAVFGWSAGSESHKRWRDSAVVDPEDSAAGRIIFHDSWPLRWPQVIVDIVNNHHKGYYAGEDDPGDWEDPLPVYFLAVGADVTFEFALSDRRPSNDGLLNLAQSWLTGALVLDGAGAKTAAGYGRFEPLQEDNSQPVEPLEAPLSSCHNVTLSAPAFLAGALQSDSDCDLRPATLRGLLRWWWRTIYAKHVNMSELLRLEAAVWGNTQSGSPVRIALAPRTQLQPKLHPSKKDRSFLDGHGIRTPQRGRKVTQGLFYGSYGMAEQGNYRWTMPEGASWKLTLTARNGYFPLDNGDEETRALPASLLLEQAQASLWLLLRFGGAGARSRKGFGSFDDLAVEGISSVQDCLVAGEKFRSICGLASTSGHTLHSPALEDARIMEIHTPWKDPWFALDRVGETLQLFAKSLRDEERIPLGLPRKTGRGRDARQLKVNEIQRHASPAMWSLAANAEDHSLTVRLITFPAARLPDHNTSQKILDRLVEFAGVNLKAEVGQERSQEVQRIPRGRRHRAIAARSDSAAPVHSKAKPILEKGTIVEACLIEGFTKKGGWGAVHVPTGSKRPIQNSADVPDTATDGDKAELLVFANDAFRWLTDKVRQDHERSLASHGRPSGGRSPGRQGNKPERGRRR